jgi:hypothetical protein
VETVLIFYDESIDVDFNKNIGDCMMGEVFLRFYKQKLKKEWKTAFFSTFIVALLVHLYKFVNT